MEYVKLGRTGLEVSRICLGCMSYGQSDGGVMKWPWTLSEEDSRPYIKSALENGINFFDTANVYSHGESERVVGRALRDFAKRDEVVIATKLNFPMRLGPNGKGLSRKAIFYAIDESLKRLGTDYVDLYIIHRYDYETPLEETLEALDEVVRSGKALYLGASSMHSWQFMKALGLQRANGWSPFISMQNYYNLLYREEEREMLPLCKSEGIGVTPWSPLARGRLARPWQEEPQTERAKNDPFAQTLYEKSKQADKPIVDRVIEIAKAHGVSPAQVALAWMLSKPVVTAPIIGATKPHQLDDALKAVSLKLSDEQITYLEELYVPHHAPEGFV
ncbi:aldo/keto reductase [Hyphomicrobium sp.]|uniref:aldo/keto reductase n=1 Tax=Hyphomicrobium sp. TaxID=82 RepID=UPI002D7A2F6D|nr:aldo/keto reductase [Hyphomicrobium sp.]HET6388523.1 aldo/keto reductase [Hyphomicrobium sp.]